VEFGRFAQISLGSISELDYHLLLSRDLGLLPEQGYDGLEGLLNETKRMLISLIQKLRDN
jgi:four helix bundle protein